MSLSYHIWLTKGVSLKISKKLTQTELCIHGLLRLSFQMNLFCLCLRGICVGSISCLAALQRHGECLALVNKRLEKDSTNPDLYVMRARLHDMFGNVS